MSVLDRPLFRQAGGPAQPMPQDMMLPQGMPQDPAMGQDPMAAIQGLEQQAAGQMKQVGQQYAMETMAKLDAASDPKQIIDALRGNERPLEERYAELAQYVGQEDAAATPESVLAFVQPTLMMTEEGAMDTGIGQLIQSMTGETDMAGDMGQGVGSLMMAGAQEVPAPANFRRGGPVQKFKIGGDVNRAGNIRTAYEELLPLYQDILGQREEDRNMSKAQSYFDLAGAGLALAGGVDPRTGQSMAGAPLASQIARAAAPLPAQFGARAAAQRDAERQIQGVALQGAMSQQQAEEAFKRELELAQATRKGPSPELYRVGDKTYNIADPAQLAAALAAEKETNTPGFKVSTEPTSSKTDLQLLVGPNGKVVGQFDFSDPTSRKEGLEARNASPGSFFQDSGTYSSDTYSKLPSLTDSQIVAMFGDTERLAAYAQGAEDALLEAAMTEYTQSRRDPITGNLVQNELPPLVLATIKQREQFLTPSEERAQGVTTGTPSEERAQGVTTGTPSEERAQGVTTGTPSEDVLPLRPGNETDKKLVQEFKQIIDPDVKLAEATGVFSGFKRWANNFVGVLQELGVGPGVVYKDTQIGTAQLDTLNTEFIRYLTEGRILADELKQYREQIPDPRRVSSDSEALEKINSLRSGLSLALDRAQAILDNPKDYLPTTVSQAREDIVFLRQLSDDYDTASDIYTIALKPKKDRPPIESFVRP
jgi:hypothetical protein